MQLGVVVHAFGNRQTDLCKFEANLVYLEFHTS